GFLCPAARAGFTQIRKNSAVNSLEGNRSAGKAERQVPCDSLEPGKEKPSLQLSCGKRWERGQPIIYPVPWLLSFRRQNLDSHSTDRFPITRASRASKLVSAFPTGYDQDIHLNQEAVP